MPHLKGDLEDPPHENLFWRFWRVSACRQGKWKLIKVAENPLKEDRKLLQPLQLFNLDADPYERRNVASQYPEIVQQLSKKLDDWDGEMQKPRWYDGQNWRHWQEAQLKNHKEL